MQADYYYYYYYYYYFNVKVHVVIVVLFFHITNFKLCKSVSSTHLPNTKFVLLFYKCFLTSHVTLLFKELKTRILLLSNMYVNFKGLTIHSGKITICVIYLTTKVDDSSKYKHLYYLIILSLSFYIIINSFFFINI
jgi:hypothetical protein